MKSGISALGDWDKAGNDKPLAKLTDRQNEGLAQLESFMEGRRTLKDVSTHYNIPSKYEMCHIVNTVEVFILLFLLGIRYNYRQEIVSQT